MNGVKFDDKHSITDWDLLMTNKTIEEPEPITNYVEVPYMDGALDLTDCFGTVRYSNRNITIDFDLFQQPIEWFKLKTRIGNYLHGLKKKIIFDIDPEFYYLGRCRISSFTNDGVIAHITIECNCDPYKYKLQKTIKNYDVKIGSSSKKIAVYNLKRCVVPKIIVDRDTNIKFNNKTFFLSKGDNQILDIQLAEGENIFEILSTAKITFEYQEATF